MYKESQDFAGNGIAALSCIPMDRDVLHSGGAVQYMVDLLLTGKTTAAKCNACEVQATQRIWRTPRFAEMIKMHMTRSAQDALSKGWEACADSVEHGRRWHHC